VAYATFDISENLNLTQKLTIKLVTKAQFSTVEVLEAMPMSRWEFRIVPFLAGENASVMQHASRCWSCVFPMRNDLRLWVCFGILRRNINLSLLLLIITIVLLIKCVNKLGLFYKEPNPEILDYILWFNIMFFLNWRLVKIMFSVPWFRDTFNKFYIR